MLSGGFPAAPFLLENLPRWGLSYLPGMREFYMMHKSKESRTWRGGKGWPAVTRERDEMSCGAGKAALLVPKANLVDWDGAD